jgi:UDP-glucose 4-epimerase
VAALLGRPLAPILPPWGTGLGASALRPLGLRVPAEVLRQLRYGRGVDNRKLKAAGCRIGRTTRETVIAHAEAMRVRPLLSGEGAGYRYEREVEEFLRWSPHVRRREGADDEPRPRTGTERAI